MRRNQPQAFAGYHRALFDAYFARGRDLGDPQVLVEEGESCGVARAALDEALRTRSMREAVDRSTREALEAGVSGTPAWLLDRRLLVPGCQPRETFDRIIGRMQQRAQEA